MSTSPAQRFRYGEILAVIVLGALLLYVLGTTAELFLLLFLAAVLALYLDAVADYAARRLHLPRWAALGAAVAASFGLAVGFIALVVPPVIEQGTALLTALPAMAVQFERAINALAARIPALAGVYHPREHPVLLSLVDSITEFASNFAGSVFGAAPRVIAALSAFVIGIYLAADPARYVDAAVTLAPPREREFTRSVLGDIAGSLRAWIVGQLINMLILGSMMAIGLKLLGVPYWLAFGVFTFAASLVPFFGSLAATILPALVALGGTGSPGRALAVLALGLFIHLVEGNVLAPLVMSVQVELPPAATMFGILVFGALLGPLGVLVAVPALAVIGVLVKRVLLERVYGSDRFRTAPLSPAPPQAEAPAVTPS